VTAILLLVLCLALTKPPARPYTTWRDYGGSTDSMQYSALAQINRANVKQLQRVWFYAVPGDPVRLPFNPLIVDDVMYVAGTKNRVVALNAATGAPLWTSAFEATERGITYWESKDRLDRRLILTTRTGLRAIDARTGTLIQTFGVNGIVDMRTGEPRRLGGPPKSPGRIFENLIIVGSNTGEGYGSPPGDVRAFDVVSGKLVWTFHTIPRPGEYGYETWPEGAWKYAGGVNVWGDITLDEKYGLVFLPTGSPTHDLYGADRAGDNLFGNCLIALDARTGKRRWHFQTVHHDLWDYDLAASPKLLTVRHNGRNVDIVAQAGKTGFLYVFERRTGRPLWPIEERRVPKSEVPGEVSSPTQPFPTTPPPFARQVFRPEDANPFVSADEHERLRAAVRDAANEGIFTPSSHQRHHIQFPGAWAARIGAAPQPIRRPGCCSSAVSRCRATGSCPKANRSLRRRSPAVHASSKDSACTNSSAPAATVPASCRCDRPRNSRRINSARCCVRDASRCRRSRRTCCRPTALRRSRRICCRCRPATPRRI
jgi:quinoprotein glucose dehydrogenase